MAVVIHIESARRNRKISSKEIPGPKVSQVMEDVLDLPLNVNFLEGRSLGLLK
jgi:hypothetical protein